jgi:hypothetical protein
VLVVRLRPAAARVTVAARRQLDACGWCGAAARRAGAATRGAGAAESDSARDALCVPAIAAGALLAFGAAVTPHATRTGKTADGRRSLARGLKR